MGVGVFFLDSSFLGGEFFFFFSSLAIASTRLSFLPFFSLLPHLCIPHQSFNPVLSTSPLFFQPSHIKAYDRFPLP